MNKKIDVKLKMYSCDMNKNKNCKKIHCKNYCNHTLQYKYAKKNLLNFIKKSINKIRGEYKYE